MSSLSEAQAQHVVWQKDFFSSQPLWTREPDPSVIESLVARRHLGVLGSSTVVVTFLSQGASN